MQRHLYDCLCNTLKVRWSILITKTINTENKLILNLLVDLSKRRIELF